MQQRQSQKKALGQIAEFGPPSIHPSCSPAFDEQQAGSNKSKRASWLIGSTAEQQSSTSHSATDS